MAKTLTVSLRPRAAALLASAISSAEIATARVQAAFTILLAEVGGPEEATLRSVGHDSMTVEVPDGD